MLGLTTCPVCQYCAPESLSLEPAVEEYTAQQVAEFLQSVGLGQYSEKFLESDISGDMLLQADDDVMEEVGVQSRLHRVQIVVQFRRHVLKKNARLKFGMGWFCVLKLGQHYPFGQKLLHLHTITNVEVFM